jgi:hypothetical protein
MPKPKKPLLSDQFLDELAKEISELYGGPLESEENSKDTSNRDDKSDQEKN